MQKFLAMSTLALALLAVGDQAVQRWHGHGHQGQAWACGSGGDSVKPGTLGTEGDGTGDGGDCLTR